jgi:hypothetical protein
MGSLSKIEAPPPPPDPNSGIVVVEAPHDVPVSDVLFPNRKPLTADQVLKSGGLAISPSHPNLDALAAHVLLAREPGKGLDFGTTEETLEETVSLLLKAELMAKGNGKPFVQFAPVADISGLAGADDNERETRLRSFSVLDGEGPTKSGTFVETLRPEEKSFRDADVVGRDASGLQVKRQWREVWVVADLSESTVPVWIAQRLFLKLDGSGNPVVGYNDFSATASPKDIAKALDPTLSGDALEQKSKDYVSGMYVFKGDDPTQNPPPGPEGRPLELATPVGDYFRTNIGLQLGWNKAPTNDSESWEKNRTDFPAVLREVQADDGIGGGKVDDKQLAALKAKAIAALANPPS